MHSVILYSIEKKRINDKLQTIESNVKESVYNMSKTDSLYVRKVDRELDFVTYFNSFSLEKWKRYTNISGLKILVDTDSTLELEVIGLDKEGKKHTIVFQACQGNVSIPIDIWQIDYPIIGILIHGQRPTDDWNISYQGCFDDYSPINIRGVICTFNREPYLRKNINVLRPLLNDSNWFDLVIVDNGQNLSLQENNKIKIYPNRNFGGSGGFTRGIIESLRDKNIDYVLLMDDDIEIDPLVIKRAYIFLSCLKKEFKESILAGAMLSMDEPTIQYENKAYWDKFRLKGIGKGLDLSMHQNLIINERIEKHSNMYGAWWFCCIPIQRIKKIGLPLPVFIKGDDMEYGIRNQCEVLSLNGIGVWHESFASKVSPVINYYSDRNMLIMNNYANDCNGISLCVAVLGRIVKRLFSGNLVGLRMLGKALKDYCLGFEEITRVGADKKMQELILFSKGKMGIQDWGRLIFYSFYSLIFNSKIKNDYIRFKQEKLMDDKFWKRYLGIK